MQKQKNITKEFLGDKIDGISCTLDFPYDIEQRYKKYIRKMMNNITKKYCIFIKRLNEKLTSV